MNGWLLIGLGSGVIIGIMAMLIDGEYTRAQVATPPLQCLCTCDGDSAVLEIITTTGEGNAP